jgi:hypothetical protein
MQIEETVKDALRRMRGGLTQLYVEWLKERWNKEALALVQNRQGDAWQAGRLAMLREIIDQLDKDGTPL